MAGAAVCELASFSSQARGIKFYEVSISEINVGDHVHLNLEPDNNWDSNCIALMIAYSSRQKNLAREASCHLSHLISAGFQASA